MPKLTPEQWQELRASREIGASFSDLARRFGVSRQCISKRSKAEGWQVDPEAAAQIRERVAVKVASDPAKKKAVLDQVADQVAEVIKTHRAEWQGHRGLFPLKDLAKDFNLGKAAKISCEMLALRQRAERSAWGLDDPDQGDEVEIVIQRSWGLKE